MNDPDNPLQHDLPQERSEYAATGSGDFGIAGEADTQIDLGSALGASRDVSTQLLKLYIPSKDQYGRRVWRQRQWVNEAARLLATLGGGVTIMPRDEGGWYNPDNKQIVWERPVIVYTFVKPKLFLPRLTELREFLHRLGRQTRQGEIGFEFDGEFYRIYRYDS